jgi:hypothetical protein
LETAAMAASMSASSGTSALRVELFVLVGQVDGFEQDDHVGDGGGVLGEAFGGLALDADVVDVEPSRSATRSRISPARGTILGRCMMRTQSMLTILKPTRAISSSAVLRKRVESAPFHLGSVGGRRCRCRRRRLRRAGRR